MVAPHLALEFNRVRRLREDAGWTQDQVLSLAESLGIGRDFNAWGWDELDKLIEAMSHPVTCSKTDTYYNNLQLKALADTRAFYGLSQQQVIDLAKFLGLSPDPKAWRLSADGGSAQIKIIQAIEKKHG